uniref:Uncharacterized protein n=1 Tax=Anguilla anguilla TaxID=7936 RepID=A0A0E9XR84_ANGAN
MQIYLCSFVARPNVNRLQRCLVIGFP